MAYGFSTVIGVFVGSAWDIMHNHGHFITVVGRVVLDGVKAIGFY